MIQAGETPNSQMSSVDTIGIQQLDQVILADRAMLKIGTANKATTAGRTPLKKASTQGLSLNCENTIAIPKMMTILGTTTPNEAMIPDLIPPNL